MFRSPFKSPTRAVIRTAAAQAGGGGGVSEPPEEIVSWLKLDDVEIGEFPSDNNSGDPVVVDARDPGLFWRQVGFGDDPLVVASTGGVKYLENPGVDERGAGPYINEDPWTSAAQLENIASLGEGILGAVFNVELISDDSTPYLTPLIYGDKFPIVGIGQHATNGKLIPFVRGSSVLTTEHDYTSETWRAIVIRWDGPGKLYSKMDGEEEWTESTGSLTGAASSLMNAALAVGRSQSEPAGSRKIADVCTGPTQTEEIGDALLAFLTSRMP